jgi:TonB family protein
MKTLAIALLALGFTTPAYAAEKIVVPKQAVAIDNPQPKYPLLASMRGEQGTGFFVMRIDISSGRVKEVYIVRSTGHGDLDSAAVKALKRWRFKPGALPPITKIMPGSKDPLAAKDSLVKLPITFELR